MTQIKTEYCNIKSQWGNRQVRFLISGSGPLIFLLHQSPKSADEYKPQIELWSKDFTIIAPDTPGYGDSDPLAKDQVTIENIAQANIELADTLKIKEFGLYGFHTGAIISIAMAYHYPDRVKAIACNGVLVLSDNELENIREHYLPPYTPQWDGSHLSWLWSRMREQLVFFPWHERKAEARMKFDISDPKILHENSIEIMRAGDKYRQAYGAAFEYRLERFVTKLTVPGLITAGETDPLSKCLEELTPSDSVSIETSETHKVALEKSRAILLKHPAESSLSLQLPVINDRNFTKSIIHSIQGDIKIEKNFETSTNPLFCLHPAGGSSKTIRFITESMAKEIDVCSVDLPGHGESDKDLIETDSIKLHTDIISQILNDEDSNQISIMAFQTSSASALDAAKNISVDVKKIILIEPWILDDQQINDYINKGLPQIKPDWSGGHLQAYWHMVRDSRLFWPWYNRTISGIIKGTPDLEEKQLDIEVTELIRSEGCWQKTMADQLAYPTKDCLFEIASPILILGRQSHPLQSAYIEIEKDVRNIEYHSLEGDPKSWGLTIKKCIL